MGDVGIEMWMFVHNMHSIKLGSVGGDGPTRGEAEGMRLKSGKTNQHAEYLKGPSGTMERSMPRHWDGVELGRACLA